MKEIEIENPHIKRVVADIPTMIHSQMKAHAAMRNISIRKFILQAVLEKISREREYLKDE